MKNNLLFPCILLLTFSIKGIAQQENSYPIKSTLWHSNTISVCWDNPSPQFSALMDTVREAIKQSWEKYSLVSFTDWCPSTQKDCDIHIFISDEAPYTVAIGNQLKNKPKGMVLNFSFSKWNQEGNKDKIACLKADAVHQFGHALGFAHEQFRDDCPLVDCLGKEPVTGGDWYVSICDINSVMNNCNPKNNSNGQLSKSDIEALHYMYGSSNSSISSNASNDAADPENFFKIAYTDEASMKKSPYSNNTWHQYKIYVVAQNDNSENIVKVVYHLGPKFKYPDITITSKEDHFGIGFNSKEEFQITADVYIKGVAEKLTVKKYLAFDVIN